MLSQHSTNKSIKIIIFKTKIPKPKQFLKKQILQRIITCFKLFWVFLFPSLFLRRDLGFKALILSKLFWFRDICYFFFLSGDINFNVNN